MNNIFKETKNKIITGVIITVILVASFGMTVMAETGTYCTVTGSLNGNQAKVTLINTSGTTRYSSISIYQYNSESSKSYVAGNSGTISSGNSISKTGGISQSHAVGYGYVCKGSSSSSGTAESLSTSIK